MGELGALFNPGMRHELEERRAKAARREEEGNARDGDLRIDLESGVAVINIADEDDDTVEASSSKSADDSEQGANSDPDSVGARSAVDPESNPAPPAPLRPRGKRGMSTSAR